MSEIICPVCNYPTVPNGIEDIEDNIICPACYRHGSKKLWDSFISTKKKLDMMADVLRHADWFFDGDYNVSTKDMHNEIRFAIKALEQINKSTKRISDV